MAQQWLPYVEPHVKSQTRFEIATTDKIKTSNWIKSNRTKS